MSEKVTNSDKKDNASHTKPIINGDYNIGIRFDIILEVDSILVVDMPIDKSDKLIVSAVNSKYNTDFNYNNLFLNHIKIDRILSNDIDVVKIVNDDIFKYQYTEANELNKAQYYLGSACVFGVARERVLLLMCLKNDLKLNSNSTQLGDLIYLLKKNNVITDPDYKRMKSMKGIRNLSSHTNLYSLKSDSDALKNIIIHIVSTYF